MTRRIDRPLHGKHTGGKKAATKHQGELRNRMGTTKQRFAAGKVLLANGRTLTSSASEAGPVPVLKSKITPSKKEVEEKEPNCPSGILYNPPLVGGSTPPFDPTYDTFGLVSGDAVFNPVAGNIQWKSDQYDVALSWSGAEPYRYHYRAARDATDKALYCHGKKVLEAPLPILGACYRRDSGVPYVIVACANSSAGRQIDFYSYQVQGFPYPVCTLLLNDVADTGTLVGSITDFSTGDEIPSGGVFFNESGTQCTFTTTDSSIAAHAPWDLYVYDVTLTAVTLNVGDSSVATMPDIPAMDFYRTDVGSLTTSRRAITGLPAAVWGTWDSRVMGYHGADFQGDDLVWARVIYVPEGRLNVLTGEYEEDSDWLTGSWVTRDGAGVFTEVRDGYDLVKDHYYRGDIHMQFKAGTALAAVGTVPLRTQNVVQETEWTLDTGTTYDCSSLTGGGKDVYTTIKALDLRMDAMVSIIVEETLGADGLTWGAVPDAAINHYAYGELKYAIGSIAAPFNEAPYQILEAVRFPYEDFSTTTQTLPASDPPADSLIKSFPAQKFFGTLERINWQNSALIAGDDPKEWWWDGYMHTIRGLTHHGDYLRWTNIDNTSSMTGTHEAWANSYVYPAAAARAADQDPYDVVRFPRWVYSIAQFLLGKNYPS